MSALFRLTRIALALFLFLIAPAQCKLTQDFIKGFETGIMLRTDSHALRDYSCPRPESSDDGGLMQRLNSLIAPMKLMAAMMKEERLDQTVAQLDIFVTGMYNMMNVFQGDYDAGDFCKGLIFGKDGSAMLYNIALKFVEEQDNQTLQSESSSPE